MAISRNILFLLAVVVAAETAIAGNDFGQSSRDSAVAITPKRSTTSKTQLSTADEVREMKPLFLTGLDGVRHSLADWNGKVIVLNFWATWCSPCLYEIRDFVVYQEQYKARGLQIIGLGLDDEKKLRNVQRTLEINYPVLIADPVDNSGLMKLWGNSSGVIPYTVVIDRDGRMTYSHRGQMNRDVFDEYVLPLLDKV